MKKKRKSCLQSYTRKMFGRFNAESEDTARNHVEGRLRDDAKMKMKKKLRHGSFEQDG